MAHHECPGIQISDVSKSYHGNRILKNISFDVPPGKIAGLLGPNGSGKSTAMRTMLELTIPETGRTTFDGMRFSDLPWPGRAVGALLDPTAHHPGRSVYDTLANAAILAGAPLARVKHLVGVLGLAAAARRRFGALSLGMKQRVALAVALVGQPRHLVLDEPMNGLDVETAEWLRGVLIHHTQTTGGSVLVSTHLLAELETLADHLVVLSAGSVQYAGDLEGLLPLVGSTVIVEEPALLEYALKSRAIPFQLDTRTHRFSVGVPPRQLSEICNAENILMDELAQNRESIADAYRRLTHGEYSVEGYILDAQ